MVKTCHSNEKIVAAFLVYDVIDDFGNTINTFSAEHDLYESIRGHRCIPGVGAFNCFRILDNVHGLDTTFTRFLDVLFWLEAGLAGLFQYIPNALGKFWVHSNSQTAQGGIISTKETIGVSKKFFQKINLPEEQKAIQNGAFSNAYYLASTNTSQEKQGEFLAANSFTKSILPYPNKLHVKEEQRSNVFI